MFVVVLFETSTNFSCFFWFQSLGFVRCSCALHVKFFCCFCDDIQSSLLCNGPSVVCFSIRKHWENHLRLVFGL